MYMCIGICIYMYMYVCTVCKVKLEAVHTY